MLLKHKFKFDSFIVFVLSGTEASKSSIIITVLKVNLILHFEDQKVAVF
jgi:hypothetical protein